MLHPDLKRLATMLLSVTATTFLAPPAKAGDEPPPANQERNRHENGSSHEGEIVVAGHPPTDFSLLASTATLEGDALLEQTRGQLGETLRRLPGVSSTSFAPGASRPVLRGFDGDRIRVLTDGIGAIDASSVSADHAVVFDALTVDHIDIVHGPAALLFGGQAIGGAVNAVDKRIPRSVPEHLQANAIGAYGTAADERSLAAAVQAPLGGTIAISLDANWRESGDLRTGGFVNAAPLRRELHQEAGFHRAEGEVAEAGEFEALAALSRRIPDSSARSFTLGAGAAHIAPGGNIGLSVQHYGTKYGVPLRPGGGHGHAEAQAGESLEAHGGESVAIDLRQTRVDLRGEIKLGGGLDSVQLRGAYGDYRHLELEAGAVGTRFAGNGIEARIDLIQAERNGWRGRSGFQLAARKLSIRGAEAFVPDNRVFRFGIFTLQSLRVGAIEFEAAGRYEHVQVTSRPAGFSRSFNLWSGAIGVSHTPADGVKIGANYIRSARAPAPEELLSDSLHVATQAFEKGNPDFRTETSDGFEAYLRYQTSRASFSLTGYATHFGNFIAALPTGRQEDGFPVFGYAQLAARFLGFEASASVDALSWDGGKLTLDGAADYTRAQLKAIGPVPRIPPLRRRGGIEMRHKALRLRAEVEWNAAQNRVAAFEHRVAGFALVNLSADWHPLGEDGALTLLLSADNILDATGRRAASFTRDFVPIAGRDIRLTARIAF